MRLCHFLCFKILQTILNLLNNIIRLLSVHAQRNKMVCIERIVWRYRLHDFAFASKMNFATLNWQYVDSSAVLQMKNVTVYEITKDEVTLVTLCNNLHAYNNVRIPFFFDTCFKEATNVVRIPIWDFNELVKTQLGPRLHCKIAILHNVGRCGGTLLCHMLAAANPKKILVFSEHDLFVQLHLVKPVMAESKFLQLLRSCLSFMSFTARDYDLLVVKPRLFTITLATTLEKVMPECKQVLIDRNVYKVIDSMIRAFSNMELYSALRRPDFCIQEGFQKVFKWQLPKELVIAAATHLRPDNQDISLLIWAAVKLEHRKLSNSAVFYYEKLLSSEEEIRKLFEAIEAPKNSSAEAALIAVSYDSQEGSVISQKMLTASKTVLDHDFVQRMRRFCCELELQDALE